MRTRRARGQSLVETALSLMVFVTILLFGIYFAEVGALTLKVQEAANFALWDATARVMHDPAGNEWGRDTASALAANEAQERYADFDGRERMGGTGVALQQALARANRIQVECQPDLPAGVPTLRPAQASAALATAMTVTSQGMRCTASSRLSGTSRIGRFMEPSFFRVSQRRAAAAFTACAAGRASNGECTGRFGLMLDDWGLSGVAEGRACALNINGASRCNNPDYYNWTERLFVASGGGGGAGSAMASLVSGGSPIYEGQFFMSFRGEEDDYEQDIGASHAGFQPRWEVSPFRVPNGRAFDVPRNNTWLGGVPR